MADNFYHFSGHKAATNLDEPVFLSKFRLIVTLPPILMAKYGTTQLLTQQVNKINGYAPDQYPGIAEQMFAGVKRKYVGTNPDAGGVVELDCDFLVNTDRALKMYPLNLLRDWSKMGYDAQTGLGVLKRDLVGTVTLEVHDKVKNTLQRFFAPYVQPGTAPTQMDLDYGKSTDLYAITGYKLICEGWTNISNS